MGKQSLQEGKSLPQSREVSAQPGPAMKPDLFNIQAETLTSEHVQWKPQKNLREVLDSEALGHLEKHQFPLNPQICGFRLLGV